MDKNKRKELTFKYKRLLFLNYVYGKKINEEVEKIDNILLKCEDEKQFEKIYENNFDNYIKERVAEIKKKSMVYPVFYRLICIVFYFSLFFLLYNISNYIDIVKGNEKIYYTFYEFDSNFRLYLRIAILLFIFNLLRHIKTLYMMLLYLTMYVPLSVIIGIVFFKFDNNLFEANSRIMNINLYYIYIAVIILCIISMIFKVLIKNKIINITKNNV